MASRKLTCKVMDKPRSIFILLHLLEHLPLQPLDVSEPLQPVGGVGVSLVVDGLDVDDSRQVAMERHLTNMTRQVGVRDDLRRGQVTQLCLKLCFTHYTDSVALKIQWFN